MLQENNNNTLTPALSQGEREKKGQSPFKGEGTKPVFQALGFCLVYPDEGWKEDVAQVLDIVQSDDLLSPPLKTSLQKMLADMHAADNLDLQEDYVATFDRTRSLSLHLFEHVHGESRDRGQAMIDLIEHYKQHGLEISAQELPDYLPLFLEFLSVIPKDEALSLLKDTAPILAAIAGRLEKRESRYAAVFAALCALSDAEPVVPLSEAPENIDDAWAEEPVDFLGAKSPETQSCATSCQSMSRATEKINQMVEALK